MAGKYTRERRRGITRGKEHAEAGNADDPVRKKQEG
jgi:hypothetical protein